MGKRSVVGDLINFRGFVYGPVNEMGVVALFAMLSEELGFIIEEVRSEFPDCIARRKVTRGWERVTIEFEYKSSSFRRHGHDSSSCDLIVCWEHDWDACPVPVLALKAHLTDSQANVPGGLRRPHVNEPLEIRTARVTAGGIRNGYIRLGLIDSFWPQECLGGNVKPAAKHLIVDFEGIGRITTDISGRHKTFRSAHAHVKEFMRAHKLRAGDIVEIVRIAKHEYKVRPAEAARKSDCPR
ncbi:MAG: hypothetical protein NTW96_11700 [Planctomycetia bacterium]|nr:hypothetical protein [Planctomycetia bacterium]